MAPRRPCRSAARGQGASSRDFPWPDLETTPQIWLMHCRWIVWHGAFRSQDFCAPARISCHPAAQGRRSGVTAPERKSEMSARIYRPAKTAMQSGKANTREWRLDYDPEVPRSIDPIMGYTSSSDMKQQIRMRFDAKDEAIAYAERHGIAYRVIEPKEAKRRRVVYSDNFRFDRKQPWTH
jgi:hypothetical protein